MCFLCERGFKRSEKIAQNVLLQIGSQMMEIKPSKYRSKRIWKKLVNRRKETAKPLYAATPVILVHSVKI